MYIFTHYFIPKSEQAKESYKKTTFFFAKRLHGKKKKPYLCSIKNKKKNVKLKKTIKKMKATNTNGVSVNVNVKDYKYMTAKKIESFVTRDTHKTEKGLVKALKAENANICETFTGAKVAFMSVTIDWRKSRTWGYCPRLHAYIRFEDDTTKEYDTYASGWGYDKGSTVLANLFNFACKPNWYAHRNRAKKPYGIYTSDYGMHFEGGIGVNCYFSIAEYIGGKMVHEVEAPNYDRFTFAFKK